MAKKTETKIASKTNTSEFVLRNPEARRSTKQAIAILLIADGQKMELPKNLMTMTRQEASDYISAHKTA